MKENNNNFLYRVAFVFLFTFLNTKVFDIHY